MGERDSVCESERERANARERKYAREKECVTERESERDGGRHARGGGAGEWRMVLRRVRI